MKVWIRGPKNKVIVMHFKEKFNILGNTLICFLAENEMRRSIPRLCLYGKYEAAASSQLA